MKRELTTFKTFLPCSTFNTFFPHSYYTIATSLQCFHHVQHVPSTFLLYIFATSLPCSHHVQHVPSTFLLHLCYIIAYFAFHPHVPSTFSSHVRPTRSFYVLITYLLQSCHALATTTTFLQHPYYTFATSLPSSH